MNAKESRIREDLKSRLDRIEAPPTIPQGLLRRTKRRRIAVSAASGIAGVIVLAGAVYGASSLMGRDNTEISPAESKPICSSHQIEGMTTDISDPVGTGEGHPGVFFEVRIDGHNQGCRPTLYIELDDVPVLPPDAEGPDADEFRRSAIYLRDENPCLTTDSAAGDFLYSGDHTIGVGIACDPEQPWPHKIQRRIRFNGDRHERITSEAHGADRYPLLAERQDMKVFGPSEQPWGLCPRSARPLSRDELPDAKRAVLIAIPKLHRNLNTTDAYATSELAAEHRGPPDFPRMIRRNCDASLVDATALVTDHLPHADSASMGATTYFVSNEPRGWVIWGAW